MQYLVKPNTTNAIARHYGKMWSHTTLPQANMILGAEAIGILNNLKTPDI